MNNCLKCGKVLTGRHQKKFCSISCSASFNNLGKRRLGKDPGFCIRCGKRKNGFSKKHCSVQCSSLSQREETIAAWKSGKTTGNHAGVNSELTISPAVRSYIFQKYDSKCTKCGWSEVNEFTGRIPLHIEHIDGNAQNSTEENLTLLCPNCHSLTSTYGSRNKGSGRTGRYKTKAL